MEAGNIAAAQVIYGLPAVRPVLPMRQNRKQQMMAANGVVGVPLRPSPKGVGSHTRARPASYCSANARRFLLVPGVSH